MANPVYSETPPPVAVRLPLLPRASAPALPPCIIFLCFFSNFAPLVPSPSAVTWHALRSVLRYAMTMPPNLLVVGTFSETFSWTEAQGGLIALSRISFCAPLKYSSLLELLSILPKPHYASKRGTATNMFLINRVLSQKVTKNSPKKGCCS